MFSKTMTTDSTKSYLDNISNLKEKIETADAIVIGAGAGLSASAGFTYSGERFNRYFGDFIEKYNLRDMYSASFYPYPDLESHWAYWSRQIYYNRYKQAENDLFKILKSLVENKNYFVLTTNVDHQFQMSGFSKDRLFYTQGDYGLWQCSKPCHQQTYDNEHTVRAMIALQEDMRVPSNLVPYCPKCGAPMTMNLRSDDGFVEDSGWHKAAKGYSNFINRISGKKVLFLELGVGGNTPVIIKYPFWRMTAANPNATFATINLDKATTANDIKSQSICISGDIYSVLKDLQDLK